eukprot:jgi/Chrzof1/14386/Cz09g00260.t1
MAEPQLKTEQQIIARFQEMRQNISTVMSKIADLEAEANEHQLVLKTLEPMDSSRTCYRMIGDVLVQRTVGETVPAVQRNKQGIEAVLKNLTEQAERLHKQLADFQQQYKIRVQGSDGGDDDDSEKSSQQAKPSSSSQGVLVS